MLNCVTPPTCQTLFLDKGSRGTEEEEEEEEEEEKPCDTFNRREMALGVYERSWVVAACATCSVCNASDQGRADPRAADALSYR